MIPVFEKRPQDYLQTTTHGEEFRSLIQEKKLEIVYVRPLDLSIDETLSAIQQAVRRVGAKRALIDSLSGLELALAPTFGRLVIGEPLKSYKGLPTGSPALIGDASGATPSRTKKP